MANWTGMNRFGASEQDGYGINCDYLDSPNVLYDTYPHTLFSDLAGPDIIKFGIESKYSCSLTSTPRFKAAIHTALVDMQSVCSRHAKAHL